ncbi:MAG: HAD family hydrolase [Gemmataceae bacterium]|nr:HAD family hydrolase [Gemmataceae bacterium]
MPLTLEQYASFLDTRDLPWPAPPAVQTPKAKPHLVALPDVRLVSWNIYGTLLSIVSGSLFFKHPQKFVMDLALDKTVQEFKMWASMSRKPGQPSEYMAEIYDRVLDEQRLAPSPGEKHPEILAERIWNAILKKLFQKDYKFDAGFYGSLNEYSKKVAYFFHASLQGTAAYEGAARALAHVQSCGLVQGLIADAQCFTLVQLQRGLAAQSAVRVDDVIDKNLRALSCELGARKPSPRLFQQVVQAAAQLGIAPAQMLHVGSRIVEDIAPARKCGMRTALFAGDKESLQAATTQLKDPATRPDVLLTELGQVTEIIAPQ